MTHEDWQSRALAAERTAAVLKDKVKALYSGQGSAFQHQLERARQRAEETRRRQEVMAERNAHLQRYSEVLEREVEARTRAVQDIVDNVTFGFLIIDAAVAVREGYTRSCHALLGQRELAGKSLLDVLAVPAARRADFMANIEQLFDDVMPEEMTLAQLPQRFVVQDRVLRFEGRLVRDSAGAPSGVLMSISDISSLEQAQREAAEHKMLVNLLRQRDGFLAFINDTHGQLAAAREAVARGQRAPVRRAVHTVKGNAGGFGMADIAAQIHEIEDRASIGPNELDAIDAAFAAFLHRHAAVLGIDWQATDGDAFQVSEDDITELEQRSRDPNIDLAHVLQTWTARLRTKPASAMLGPLDALVARLSAQFEKDVRLECSGGELMVDPQRMRPVLQSLTHLVRNALDHGIEPPPARGNKPAVSTLRLQIVEQESEYHVVVADDGRGVDVDALTRRAIERGLLTQERADSLSQQERLQLMFVDGLSTAETATEVSGRGVGMQAVRSAVEQAGGHMRVSTAPGSGTRFHVLIPKAAVPNVAAE